MSIKMHVFSIMLFLMALLMAESAGTHLNQLHQSMVNLTVLRKAVSKGAVCLDGSPPAYNLDKGFGSGTDSWLIYIEGGGWCNDIRSCSYRSHTPHGSSLKMSKILFQGILSSNQSQNPGFYNWNRVLVRYCDGSSFTGDVNQVNRVPKLHYRGERIWQAVMEDLLKKGLDKAQQALLSGCSAGGLTTILHCDKFREILPVNVKVKCMADAGFFIDIDNIARTNSIRALFNETVNLQGSAKNLDPKCTSKMDPSLCFFPQYMLSSIQTPLFVVNSAYDYWQVIFSLAPSKADPQNEWQPCKRNMKNCTPWQLKIMQGFRRKMLTALQPLWRSKTGGYFINSRYAHCQTQLSDPWHSLNSPRIKSKTIAEAVGDWYFDRQVVKFIESPYPCNSTC